MSKDVHQSIIYNNKILKVIKQQEVFEYLLYVKKCYGVKKKPHILKIIKDEKRI